MKADIQAKLKKKMKSFIKMSATRGDLFDIERNRMQKKSISDLLDFDLIFEQNADLNQMERVYLLTDNGVKFALTHCMNLK